MSTSYVITFSFPNCSVSFWKYIKFPPLIGLIKAFVLHNNVKNMIASRYTKNEMCRFCSLHEKTEKLRTSMIL